MTHLRTLRWPVGYPRTIFRERAKFGQTTAMPIIITLRQLADQILALPPEQQAQKAHFMGADRPGGDVGGLWIAEEDHINPTGEGDEPISAYANDTEFVIAEEPVTIKAGTVLLFESN